MSLVSFVPDEIYTKTLGSPQTANLLRVAFNAPAWAEAFVKMAAVQLSALSLKPEHRELAFLRTASYLGGRYAWAGHENLARKSGVTEKQIEAIRTGEDEILGLFRRGAGAAEARRAPVPEVDRTQCRLARAMLLHRPGNRRDHRGAQPVLQHHQPHIGAACRTRRAAGGGREGAEFCR
ncbi:carboxymuconolactone decarboxylase family protein [Aliirhizobium terrae]|uniref:carboxymuconolactone decarboxylase family protein n=1 Tax=Terrirhizobium terrae TaxID=2926709 RepID=UPI0025761864|nr:carboxymuconolactone decarboxylase family protein [Rhizobium sp. CC-CFT758]WJH40210.1 carboxymuconolactone decarboxylase family protein [Rhizobium sp. CC-CFT758]